MTLVPVLLVTLRVSGTPSCHRVAQVGKSTTTAFLGEFSCTNLLVKTVNRVWKWCYPATTLFVYLLLHAFSAYLWMCGMYGCTEAVSCI